MDWTGLSYSLYKTDHNLWSKKINDSIDERIAWCTKIENNHEDWSAYTDEEKKERLIELKAEIKAKKNTLKNGMTKPTQDLSKSVLDEPFGCLLFDCKRHENLKNDLRKQGKVAVLQKDRFRACKII